MVGQSAKRRMPPSLFAHFRYVRSEQSLNLTPFLSLYPVLAAKSSFSRVIKFHHVFRNQNDMRVHRMISIH